MMPRAIRFRMPAGVTGFDDAVHGRIEFENAVIEDFVVLRSDGHPTYHLSVVVDDIDMKITDVVRGDDHISNTPKQVLLYQALGAPMPRFAHVPLILGPDKRRLSKRHGATSVMEYERQGFLPEAMFNFLALLGWSPGERPGAVHARRTDRGVHARGHQLEQRRVQPREARVVQQPAHRPPARATSSPTGWSRSCADAGLWLDAFRLERRAWFHQVIEVLKPRAKKLADLAEHGRYFFTPPLGYDEAAVKKHLAVPGMAGHLEAWRGSGARRGALRPGHARSGSRAGVPTSAGSRRLH